MEWYGMIWYGMVWYGMVWYGMVWYGIVCLRARSQKRKHWGRECKNRDLWPDSSFEHALSTQFCIISHSDLSDYPRIEDFRSVPSWNRPDQRPCFRACLSVLTKRISAFAMGTKMTTIWLYIDVSKLGKTT